MFYVEGDGRGLEPAAGLRWPVFEEGVATLASSSCLGLDLNQVQAIEVLAAKDFTLILSMPGTRKTTVVAEGGKYGVGGVIYAFGGGYYFGEGCGWLGGGRGVWDFEVGTR